eukprot:5369956-Pyramimonas_sp.AAC.1
MFLRFPTGSSPLNLTNSWGRLCNRTLVSPGHIDAYCAWDKTRGGCTPLMGRMSSTSQRLTPLFPSGRARQILMPILSHARCVLPYDCATSARMHLLARLEQQRRFAEENVQLDIEELANFVLALVRLFMASELAALVQCVTRAMSRGTVFRSLTTRELPCQLAVRLSLSSEAEVCQPEFWAYEEVSCLEQGHIIRAREWNPDAHNDNEVKCVSKAYMDPRSQYVRLFCPRLPTLKIKIIVPLMCSTHVFILRRM